MLTIVIADHVLSARAVVRRLLYGRSEGSFVVLDYSGVAERVLDSSDVEKLRADSVTWIDLAVVDHPCRVLDLSASAEGSSIERLLGRLAFAIRLPLLPEDRGEARCFLDALLGGASGGTMTISDFGASLANEELFRWAWPRRPDPNSNPGDSRQRIRDLFDNALRFPRVAATAGAAAKAIMSGEGSCRWTWIEAPRRHMEETEWRILCCLMHGVAESAGGSGDGSENRHTVLLYPPLGHGWWKLLPETRAAGPVVALRHNPNGSPPHFVKILGEGTRPFHLEVAGVISARARTAWSKQCGFTRSIFDTIDAGEPVAVQRVTSGFRIVAPRALPCLSEAPRADLSNLKLAQLTARPGFAVSRPRAETVSTMVFRDPYDRLRAPETLLMAWSTLVASGGGSTPGMDRVNLSSFGARLDTEIGRLSEELAQESYRPLPVSWATIPKADGSPRRIGVSAIRDRVVQRTFVAVCEPYFEVLFSDRSFAYRRGRGAHHALMAIVGLWRRGFSHMAHVDVKSCFDSLPHDVILSRFAERIPSPRVITLLSKWLRLGLLGCEGPADPLGVGVVQGWSMSPFLANIVLDDLDKQLEQREIEFVRYADDIGILARSEDDLQQAVDLAGRLLTERLQLRLNREKTRLSTFAEGIDHLGFRIGGSEIMAMAPRRFLAQRESLANNVLEMEKLEDVAAMARAIDRLRARLDGLAAYFCRLGMTRALDQQFQVIAEVIEEGRLGLPSKCRDHPSWSRIPAPDDLGRRFGRFEIGFREIARERGFAYESSRTESDHWTVDDEPAANPPVQETNKPERSSDQTTPPIPVSNDTNAPAADLIGRTVFVFRGGVSLRADDNFFRILERGREVMEVRLADIEMVHVHAFGVSVSSRTIWSLAANKTVLLCSCPTGADIGVVIPPGSESRNARVQQARALDLPSTRLVAARMMGAKIANQASVLRYLARAPGRKESAVGEELRHFSNRIRPRSRSVIDVTQNCTDAASWAAKMMGHEGLAAAQYWHAIRLVIPEALGFPGRRTRGATDPVNASLNYAYSLLYAEVWKAVTRVGLDPGLGILHVADRSSGGLVFDLIEELRAPLVDRVVLSLIGRGWRPATTSSGSARLLRNTRSILSRAFRRQLSRKVRRGRGEVTAGELPLLQAKALRDIFQGKEESYPAYRFRW